MAGDDPVWIVSVNRCLIYKIKRVQYLKTGLVFRTRERQGRRRVCHLRSILETWMLTQGVVHAQSKGRLAHPGLRMGVGGKSPILLMG